MTIITGKLLAVHSAWQMHSCNAKVWYKAQKKRKLEQIYSGQAQGVNPWLAAGSFAVGTCTISKGI